MPYDPNDRRQKPGRQSVYIAEMASDPPVHKIGVSHDPARRIEHFRWGPWPVKVVHVIESADAGAIESWLHFRFRERHVRHEWFRLTMDELDALMTVEVADATSDLPAFFMPTDFTPWSTRRGKANPKPFSYKFKFRHKDPGHSAIPMAPEQALAMGAKFREARIRAGIIARDMEVFLFFSDESYRPKEPFRNGITAFPAMESGKMMLPFRIQAVAVNLRLSVEELVGPELIELVPVDYRGKMPLPASFPDDWTPNRGKRLADRRQRAKEMAVRKPADDAGEGN